MQSDKSFYNTRTTNKIQKNIYSFFPTGLPASHFWNLMLSIALFSALTWDNVALHYEVKPTHTFHIMKYTTDNLHRLRAWERS